MAEASNVLYLSLPEEVPESLHDCVNCLPGRCAVAMYEGVSRSGLLMPLSGRLSPDLGVCVASACGVGVGQECLVKPYTGAWYENFQGSGCQVRLFGVIEPWYESIPATRHGEWLLPTHDWVLLEREYAVSEILTVSKRPTCRASVVTVGPEVKDVHPDERMVFSEPEDGLLTFKFGPEKAESWCLIREKDLLAKIE